MKDPAPTSASSRATVPPARRVAALVCALQAIAMLGFGLYGLLELIRGQATDTARVLTESVLILVFAAGMGLLAKLWLGRSSWPGTPTVVWHALLIPVIVEMFRASQWVVAGLLTLAVVLAVGATVAARGTSDNESATVTHED